MEGVSFDYGGITGLAGVDIAVDEREAVCIVGPNGAGKTTLAKTIAGILRPAAGAVFFRGMQISRMRQSEVPRHRVGIVLEGRHVFPDLSVRANLELGAYSRRLGRAEVAHEVERIWDLFPGLQRFADSAAGDLSGGQQQMLCVGRALMGDPELLILDEPSMGLSPKLADVLYGALSSLRDAGLAILLIEQNAQLAFAFCARGYVLQHGRVALAGTVEDLRVTDLVRRIYMGAERLPGDRPPTTTTGDHAPREEDS